MEKNIVINKEAIEYLKKTENESFDLIVADPPYNILKNEWDYYQNDKDYYTFMEEWIELSFKKLKKGGSIYIFNTPKNNAKVLVIAEKIGLKYRNWIVWNKKINYSFPKKNYVMKHESILFFTKGKESTFNFNDIREESLSHSKKSIKENKIFDNFEFNNPSGELSSDVWEFLPRGYEIKSSNTEEYLHPSEKPIDLIKKIILASSNKGDLVLDLFSGSGTTSLACKELERNYIAVEYDSTYINIIRSRLK